MLSFDRRSSVRTLNGVCLLLLLLALLALFGADLQVYPVDPWHELGRIGRGLLLPAWDSYNFV